MSTTSKEHKAVITVTPNDGPWDIVFDAEAIEVWDNEHSNNDDSEIALVKLRRIIDAYIELRNARNNLSRAEAMFDEAQHPREKAGQPDGRYR